MMDITEKVQEWLEKARERFFALDLRELDESMTPEERANPDLMSPSRKKRIAAGAGVDISEVNKLVKMFDQMKKMMKQMPGMMKKGRKGMFQGFPFS